MNHVAPQQDTGILHAIACDNATTTAASAAEQPRHAFAYACVKARTLGNTWPSQRRGVDLASIPGMKSLATGNLLSTECLVFRDPNAVLQHE